jgi:hypothetical protein
MAKSLWFYRLGSWKARKLGGWEVGKLGKGVTRAGWWMAGSKWQIAEGIENSA